MTFGRLHTYFWSAGLILIASFAVSGVLHAQEMGKLTGTLFDPQGAAMADFPIHLRSNNRSEAGGVTTGSVKRLSKKSKPREKWLIVNTDNAGRFSIELPAGNWDLFAYHDGFVPTCAIALIEKNETKTLDLRLPNYAPMSLQ